VIGVTFKTKTRRVVNDHRDSVELQARRRAPRVYDLVNDNRRLQGCNGVCSLTIRVCKPANDLDTKRQVVDRAVAVIQHLQSTLDMNRGGELAAEQTLHLHLFQDFGRLNQSSDCCF